MKPRINRINNIWIILLLSIFLILQIYAIVSYGDQWYLGDFNLMDNDDVKYIRSAWTLLEKNMLVYHDTNEPTVFIMPGYPTLISLFMLVFGKIDGLIKFKIFQGILQVISLFITYRLCKDLFNKKIAIISIILSILYWPEIVSPVFILTETVFKFLLLLLTYIMIRALKSKKIALYILIGLIWGLAVLIRPTIAFYPAVIFIMWILYRYSVREMIIRALVITGVFVIVMSPWWVRNYTVFHRFVPLTLSAGNPFLQGTYFNYDQSKDYTVYKYSEDAIELNKNEMETGIQRLKNNFKTKPFLYTYWYTIGKTLYLWRYPYYYKSVFNISFNTVYYYHLALLFMAFAGMIIYRNSYKKESLLLIFTVIYFNFIYLPYFTCSRYSYPLMSFIIIFASNTLFALIQRFYQGKGIPDH